ncbi:hypothetical protein EYF80_062409 [Liparis tanakae]|uniref:Uncharacterized protein n=1 Tax=Liparis tanakae TaxID=230148 RepID=A0A4Z2EEW1_9TELE|nr:hypothetical protein EYF80_062409 [Liparis tanakae]
MEINTTDRMRMDMYTRNHGGAPRTQNDPKHSFLPSFPPPLPSFSPLLRPASSHLPLASIGAPEYQCELLSVPPPPSGSAMKGCVLRPPLTAGYTWPTADDSLWRPMWISSSSSSVVLRYTGLSKFMLLVFLRRQLRHTRYPPVHSRPMTTVARIGTACV